MVDLKKINSFNDISPLVTVAMPVYNAGDYLRLAVLSIVMQTFSNWELLIIDDGSTDNALENLADINDVRIRIVQDGQNKGLAVRLNECIDCARGKYFARMDQDDVSYPERLMRQIMMFGESPTLDLVAVHAITIDECNKVTGLFPMARTHVEICAKPWLGFSLPHPTWMGKMEWFRKYRYAVPGPYFCEDQELLLRSFSESEFCTIDEILFAYRVRGKVDQLKLAKTRWTFLNIQLRHFVSLNEWHFVLLAMMVFVGKLNYDLLRRWGILNSKYERYIVDNANVLKWDTTLVDLEAILEVP